MTDVQLLIPFATFVGTLAVVVVGFSYNNSRISDLRSEMNHCFEDFDRLLDAKLARLEEMMLHKFAELNDRLIRIENRLGMRE
ncbi:MAG: hypothetical protein JOY62_12545 [Acidobacteriaceae bacterium]|nr:hypothetical protein [Acidobacteriaceae bacterium]MBV9780789.1 hypothetical protein [Acidobacteriaceae bacterium]